MTYPNAQLSSGTPPTPPKSCYLFFLRCCWNTWCLSSLLIIWGLESDPLELLVRWVKAGEPDNSEVGFAVFSEGAIVSIVVVCSCLILQTLKVLAGGLKILEKVRRRRSEDEVRRSKIT